MSLPRPLTLSLLVVFPVFAFFGGMRFQRATQLNSKEMPVSEVASTPTPPVSSLEDREKQYFVDEILPKYPALSAEFGSSQILKVYPLALRYIGDGGTGYLVEVDNTSESYSFYLVTPLVQKKLEHPMTDYAGVDAHCMVQQVLPVDRAEYLSLAPYPGNTSFFLISGNACETYGGGAFTSMYLLKTGEKLPFTPTKRVGNLYFPEVNTVGNINGTLSGVYGNPMTIAIETEYNGYDKSYLFFDFLTQKLKQAVRM